MVIPTDLTAARTAGEQILNELRACRYSDEAVFAVKLAMEEALTNAIRHGNRSDPAKKVIIEFLVDSTRAEICITDEGPGFNPGSLPDPTADENLENPSGRGIMLMRAYMDEVAFNQQGNSVRMTKLRV